MTQDDYTLYTGQTVNYSQEDWEKLVAVASGRLASLLCLDELPDPLPDDLAMLLANFLCAMLRFEGNPEPSVSSKSVRNFSISFSQTTAQNAFAQVAQNYGDLIEKYSACGLAFAVEKSEPRCCCDDYLL